MDDEKMIKQLTPFYLGYSPVCGLKTFRFASAFSVKFPICTPQYLCQYINYGMVIYNSSKEERAYKIGEVIVSPYGVTSFDVIGKGTLAHVTVYPAYDGKNVVSVFTDDSEVSMNAIGIASLVLNDLLIVGRDCNKRLDLSDLTADTRHTTIGKWMYVPKPRS